MERVATERGPLFVRMVVQTLRTIRRFSSYVAHSGIDDEILSCGYGAAYPLDNGQHCLTDGTRQLARSHQYSRLGDIWG